ncbi:ArsR/SmtB family transcription factor [Cognatazoarcus halotolerans]|uniref:ArsR/SmtB family transcription factor n=1 Tax=Cognatazoarcus halotolerans TaxID=2686016 RepID=UPI00135B46F6|nr:helix-turn-helix domain-containing protein [Cognatazoarcus halotolerans]MCB1899431.1 helix-turn-helix transcriptional regulator [Rhodocyclaceae bacterium]MCP5310119.1 helix-turn-helix transcriptional regulator [Zoogloeaceae bacterium]
MKDGPNIARVAALIGDCARADILTALMADRALTATELAGIADVTKQTASTHLAKLVDARLIEVEKQGRHRYFRLAGRDVAQLLESLMGVAFRTGAVRLRSSPREPALRKARVCYDHLAGELAVAAFEAMMARGWFFGHVDEVSLSDAGWDALAGLGIDVSTLQSARRPACRMCLDWGERRHHLAGSVGAAILRHVIDAGWARRTANSRIVVFDPRGEQAFRDFFLPA